MKKSQDGLLVEVTPRISAAMCATSKIGNVPSKLSQVISVYIDNSGGDSTDAGTSTIPFRDVQELSKFLRGQDASNPKYFLHNIMAGSSIVKDVPVKPPTDPALIKRRKLLTARMKQLEYEKLAQNVEHKERAAAVAPLDVQEGQRAFSLVLNLIITMFATFAFGWYAVGIFYLEAAMKALGGVLCMVIAVGAELYFIMKMQLEDPKRVANMKKAKLQAKADREAQAKKKVS